MKDQQTVARIGKKTTKASPKTSSAKATQAAIELGPMADLLQDALTSAVNEIKAEIAETSPKNPVTRLRKFVDDSNVGGYFTNGALIAMTVASGWFLGEKAYGRATSVDE